MLLIFDRFVPHEFDNSACLAVRVASDTFLVFRLVREHLLHLNLLVVFVHMQVLSQHLDRAAEGDRRDYQGQRLAVRQFEWCYGGLQRAVELVEVIL